MDPKTGAIASFENAEDAAKAGYHVKLTNPEAKWLLRFQGKNRKARRAELARLRKSKKGSK